MRKLTVTLLLLLAACGHSNDGPKAGRVIDRDYEEPYCTTTNIPMPSGYPSIPVTNCYPEEFWLKLRDDSGNEGWRRVDVDTYYTCEDRTWCDTEGSQ